MLKNINRVWRINWLDSMKVLGIYFIVAGHSCPPNSLILYVFSVQLFFIMSGFLAKTYPTKVFITKILKQLVIPMIILGIIYISMMDVMKGVFSIEKFLQGVYELFIGNTGTLAGLWFVYSLILSKIISNVAPKRIKPLIAIIFLALSVYLHEFTDMHIRNCYINTLLAYPLFFIGETLSKYKKQINNINSHRILIGLIAFGGIGVLFSKLYNDAVWMYLGEYGSNMVLFLLGGICGTVMCFGICKLLFDKYNPYILLLAEGSILVLAFQNFFIHITHSITGGYMLYISSLAILFAFIPLIIFCKKYCPVLLGYRGVSKIKNYVPENLQ